MTKVCSPNSEKNYFDDDEIIKPTKQSYLEKTDSQETIDSQSQPKTVRCVIDKDFDTNFKKVEGIKSFNLKKSKIPDAIIPDYSDSDKYRLLNHMKWKKQKEEEYLQKKELEKLETLKKNEERLHMEKIKKQKEKEREEKIREWQMQKAREKDEKKQNELMMKALEEEIKGTPMKVDKDRLLEEWVKLKNRQKQLESEKKAQLQRKEEESKAVRQALAEISYRQWKEKVKGKAVPLPKNGYQIYGPKPTPVVKEDWNNNFIDPVPEEEKTNPLRSSKSTTSTIRQFSKLAINDEYLGNLKKVNSSNGYLKTAKSGTDLKNYENDYESLKKLWTVNSEFPLPNNKINSASTIPKMITKEAQQNLHSKKNKTENINKNIKSSKTKGWGDFKFSLLDVLPNKKRLDLYLNGINGDNKEESDSEEVAPNTLSPPVIPEVLYPSPQRKGSFLLFDPNNCNDSRRNFSSDSSDGKPRNRRSRSHEKSKEKASVPALRVSSMPRTEKKKSSEPVKPHISQSATSLIRTQIISKQQLQKRTQKSIKGTRRRSKPRSPVKDVEKIRWKIKKNQITGKKKENIESKLEKPKKLEAEVVQPVKLLTPDQSDDEKPKKNYPAYSKTYPLAPSRIQSVRNRVMKTNVKYSGTE